MGATKIMWFKYVDYLKAMLLILYMKYSIKTYVNSGQWTKEALSFHLRFLH